MGLGLRMGVGLGWVVANAKELLDNMIKRGRL